MSEPLLALETLDPADRPYLTINGTAYTLKVPSEYGLRDQMRILTLTSLVDKSLEGEPTDGEIAQVELALRELVTLVLNAPTELIDGLTFNQHMAILTAYRKTRGFKAPAPASRAQRRRQTSGSSSRRSAGSTAPTTG